MWEREREYGGGRERESLGEGDRESEGGERVWGRERVGEREGEC